MKKQARLYFDNAATTPLDSRVLQAMKPYFLSDFGNPGSLHREGQRAVAAIDNCRERIANILGVQFRDIVFTSGATEANNLAIQGVVSFWWEKNPNRLPKIIISSIEHESVSEVARNLERRGLAKVCVVGVNSNGTLKMKDLEAAMDQDVAIVSIMYANNEIGAVQDVPQISAFIKKYREAKNSSWPIFHTDAAQALQYLRCDSEYLGYDLATFSAHKIYGPKGVGVLAVRNKNILPIIFGGGQEGGLRSGTENVPLIVGFLKAMEINEALKAKESARMLRIRGRFIRGALGSIRGVGLNGGGKEDGTRGRTLPNIVNVFFKGIPADKMMAALDLSGVAVSLGSACRARSLEASYVVKALGYGIDRAKQSIRFSFGRGTSEKDIDKALGLIRKIIR